MPAAMMQTEPLPLRPNADHSESLSGSTSESESRSSSAFSGSESDSDSDDDLSDNETLADRHKSLKRSANPEADQAAKRRRSSSDSGSHLSSGPRKKRRNLFPTIRKSQRCGKCHTCLNPQLKKACLTVREQMMREARQGSSKLPRRAGTTAGQAAARKPVAAQAPSSTTAGGGGGGAAAASTATDVDKYTDILLPFINSAGAISDTSTVQPFVKALSAFSSSLARTLPCTILNLSSTVVLSEFMAKNGVDIISSWMLQAMEEDDDHASQFLVEALSMLKQLPVNKAFVQSTKSAKVVGALRKHDSTDVRKLAREVVGLWMQVVSSSSGSSTAKSSSAGKPNAAAAGSGDATGAAAAALPAAKRLKTTGQVAGAAAAAASQQKSSASGANGAAARPGTGAGSPASAAAAGSATGANSIHMVRDGDLFKPAAASAAKPRARVGLAIPQRRSHAVQQLDTTEAAKLLGTRQQQPPEAAGQQQLVQSSAGPAAAAQEAHVQVELVVLPCDEAVTVKLLVQHPVSTAAVDSAAAGIKVPGGNAARLQGARKFGMALGPRAGAAGSNAGSSSSISALMSGAWANTPGAGASGPTPGTSNTAAVEGTGTHSVADADAGKEVKRQKKKKRLSWKEERDLVAVRWFIKDDPPSQAKQDAHLSEEQLRALTAAQHHHHSAFDQAARREHARERQLIEQQHKEAEEKLQHMRQLIEAMQPQVEWTGAPQPVVLDPQWQVAAGEGSDQSQADPRPLQQVVHQLLQPMLADPYEPHQLLQVPSAFFNVPYHDRNVKIVPLSTAGRASGSVGMEAGGPLPLEVQQLPMQQQQQQGQQLQLQQLPPQTFALQSAPPPQQQQQQQQQLLPGLAMPGQGQQLVLQPVSQQPAQSQPQNSVQLSMQPQLQQQVLGGPPPPQQQQQAGYSSLYAQPGPPPSSGPPSNNNSQAQLLQALQSLTQLQSQGGLPAPGGQQQPAPQQQQQQQQQQLAPGSSAPQLLVSTGGMQLVLQPGVQPLQHAQQQPQILQLPPGVQLPPGMVLLPQQPQQPQLYDMRGQPVAPPPPQSALGHLQLHYEQQQHRPMLRDSVSGGGPAAHLGAPDWQQQHQWHHHDGQGRGRGPLGRGVGGGRGSGRGVSEEMDENAWRRTQRVCKFFPQPRGCTKGNKCYFRHVPPGEELDVRDERRSAA